MKPVKRPYRSPRREEQAAATRRLILGAALELFTMHGFAETSVRQIASRAGVSEPTVYKAFGDKVGLLYHAALEYMASGGEGAEAAFLAALEAEGDPAARLRMVAEDSRRTWESGAVELGLMVNSSEIRDGRLAELRQRSLAYRLESARAVCAVLFPDGLRAPGLTVDDIAVFATAVDSAPVVSTVLALGWTMDDWERWLVQLLARFLDSKVVDAAAG